MKPLLSLRGDLGAINKGLMGLVLVVFGVLISFVLIPARNAQKTPFETYMDSQSLATGPVEEVISVTPTNTPDYSVIPEEVLAIEYEVIYSSQNASRPTPRRTKYLQAGDFYSRNEAAPSLGRDEVAIRNKDDYWIVNRFTKSAAHLKLIGTNSFGVIPIPTTGLKEVLRFGDEVDYFASNGAAKSREGNLDRYALKTDKLELLLFVDSDTGRPTRLESKDGVGQMRLEYLKYDKVSKFDESAFTLPKDIKVRAVTTHEHGPFTRRWIDEPDVVLGYYRDPNPDGVIDFLSALKWTPTFYNRSYLSNFVGAILRNSPDLVSKIINGTKKADPEVQLIIANGLRLCKTEPCITQLSSNPFDFETEGFKQFLEDAKKVEGGYAPSGGPDSLVAEYLFSGEINKVSQLVSFFDEQIVKQGNNSSFETHIRHYARLFKKLGKSDQRLEKLLAESKTKSQFAALVNKIEDSELTPQVNPMAQPPSR